MSGVFLRGLNAQERQHCKADLDKVTAGEMAADEFLKRWGARLREMLDPHNG